MKIDYKNKKLLSTEEVQNSDLEYAVDDTELELKSALLNTKKSLGEANNALKDLKSDYPIDIDAIVEKTLDIRDLEDGIEIIESLMTEFGFNK